MRGYRSEFKSDAVVTAAKKMRHEPTPAEKAMWRLLRSRQFVDLKFRRQYPFDQFILDFYCPKLRLAFELDGAQHETLDGMAHDDAHGTTRGMGFEVLRFSNRDVLQNKAVLLLRLKDAVRPVAE